ncbi:MAG: aspartate--tRNA(Asn) ligase [Candidatus Nitrosopolaris wilkensis]|nr:MAG: aspartate--tRNA(Asn) ligase [Candidatus Nitrosopolaris wilkensis]
MSVFDDIHRTHYTDQVQETLIGQVVSIAGWIEDIRDIGKVAFLTIRDIRGAAQVVLSANTLSVAKDKPRQSAIIVSGVVQHSKSKDFPLEIKAEKVNIVTEAIHPLPIDPTGRVESAIDKRLDSRALDLRNPKTSSIFLLRSAVLDNIRTTLRSKAFVEVNTPKIIGSASEGGANLFGFEYFKKQAYLAQSPQLYKEQLILALDRVFEIGVYFRAENSHTVRHLTEFLSVDIEAAFINYEDAMDLAEEVIRNTFNVNKIIDRTDGDVLHDRLQLPTPRFPIDRLTYEQCIEGLWKEGEKLEFGEDLSDASLRKLGEIHKGFYFIKDWPLKLKPFYIHEKLDNLELSQSFDLQYGYLELISGGQRHHDPVKLRKRLIDQGLNPMNFDRHLRVFGWGMPPHSGWGLGFDRLMMVLTHSDNIRETVLYPRDTERLIP